MIVPDGNFALTADLFLSASLDTGLSFVSHYVRNGMPKCFNSAFPSSLVLAVVTIVMSMP